MKCIGLYIAKSICNGITDKDTGKCNFDFSNAVRVLHNVRLYSSCQSEPEFPRC